MLFLPAQVDAHSFAHDEHYGAIPSGSHNLA